MRLWLKEISEVSPNILCNSRKVTYPDYLLILGLYFIPELLRVQSVRHVIWFRAEFRTQNNSVKVIYVIARATV